MDSPYQGSSDVHVLPTNLTLEVVTPEGLLRREVVDEVIAPGSEGYFGVRPGHTPMLASLGVGEISYRQGPTWQHLTCFWGFCEVLPDRVLLYSDDGDATVAELHRAGVVTQSVLVRRSSLEDVFLRLTGRSLVE